ncbi:MAG: sugar phosphate isomerase/epimerase family protein [Armatimonadota bacterium]
MIRLGYHPATFVGEGFDKFVASLHPVCAEGWDGLEYSARVFEPWFGRPGRVRSLLAQADLVLSGLYYTCGFRTDQETSAWLEGGERVARFCTEVGCGLILIDGGSKQGGGTPEQIERAAEGANAMGRLCARHGLTCSWHQHWGTIFEHQEPFERLMALTDPELVKFTPDTAQLSLGDFDVPATIRRHAERCVYVHFKDLGPDRRFTELGTGIVDFPACWAPLRETGFTGWIVVDLDYTSLDPGESCRANKRYLNQVLGICGERDRRRG